MDDASGAEGLRDRLARQGEDALGRLAQDLLENPLVNGAISKAFEARERAGQAQEAALGALNIPSAADVERLTRRLRSVSQRLEGIEDGVDRLDQRLASLPDADADPAARLGERLGAIESQLGKLAMELSVLTRAVDASPAPVPREQERLEVDPSEGAAKRTAAETTAPSAKRTAAKRTASGTARKPAGGGRAPKKAPKKR
jgi:hypothetical protein